MEALAEWSILLPLVLIGGALLYFGFRWVFVLALVVGILAWNFWGARMAFTDPKLVLVVDVVKGNIAPLIIGRKRWQDAEKVGRPTVSFRTPGGLSVEVVRSYDAVANKVEYPMDPKYSDIMIAAIPERYGELIDELVRTNRINMILSTEMEVHALGIAQKHIETFAGEINRVITPRDGKGGEDAK